MISNITKFYNYMKNRNYTSKEEYLNDKKKLDLLIKNHQYNYIRTSSSTFMGGTFFFKKNHQYYDNQERLEHLKVQNQMKNL